MRHILITLDEGTQLHEGVLPPRLAEMGFSIDQFYRLEPDPEEDEDEYAVFARLWSVSIYEAGLSHGGYEEGGWYYESGQLQTDCPIMFFDTETEAREACKLINGWMDLSDNWNLHRRPISSVLSTGRYVAKVHPEHPPIRYPETRPRYE